MIPLKKEESPHLKADKDITAETGGCEGESIVAHSHTEPLHKHIKLDKLPPSMSPGSTY